MGLKVEAATQALRVRQGHLMVSDRALRRCGFLLDWENTLEAVEARPWDNAEGRTRFNLRGWKELEYFWSGQGQCLLGTHG